MSPQKKRLESESVGGCVRLRKTWAIPGLQLLVWGLGFRSFRARILGFMGFEVFGFRVLRFRVPSSLLANPPTSTQKLEVLNLPLQTPNPKPTTPKPTS